MDLLISKIEEEYKDFWGKKLVSINGYSIEQLHSKLDPFVSKDNKAIEKTRFSTLLRCSEILKMTGITKNDEATFTFEDLDKKDITVKPLKRSKYEELDFLSDISQYANNFPLSKQNSYKNYWFQYLEKENAIYVKYNSCVNMKGYSFSSFTKDVFKTIDSKNVKTLVIDLRDNGGGISIIFNTFLKEVKKLYRFPLS